jgi:hypothetical protein
VKSVYYNGFTEEDLTGARQGVDGLEALGVEHVKPIITRGILVDVAGYKGVPVLDSRYEVSLADVRGALTKQGVAEASIEPGDAILFNYGWAVNWKTRDRLESASRWRAGSSRSASRWPAPTAAACSRSRRSCRAREPSTTSC